MTPLEHAEQAVLGALFLAPGQLDRLRGWLRPEHFDRPAHTALYAAMLKLHTARHPATTEDATGPVPLSWITDTLQEASHHTRGLTAVYPHLLVSACPRSEHAPMYGRMVLEGAIHRSVTRHADQLHQAALADLRTGTADETVHHAEILSDVLADLAHAWGTEPRPLQPPTAQVPRGCPPPPVANQILVEEEHLLGCLATRPEQLLGLVHWLHPDDFADQGHQQIYRALGALHHRGEPIDQLTVLWETQRRGSLTNGTLTTERIRRICGPLAGGGAAEHYGEQVLTASLARTATTAAQQVRALADQDALAPGQLINYALYALSPLDDVRRRQRIANGIDPGPPRSSPQIPPPPARSKAARARSRSHHPGPKESASPTPAGSQHVARPSHRSPS
ncbi:DnaB-like helicase N-terminal domain-containing protein [Streptomyces sp. NBC_00483]|uniref:DnaB-like helicase N-terminal domain-containing protein n=1 Tax=Streptomyces sp. NBC_00483 TaxID=2975756 RepID=UPI002E16BAA4